jgi:hypothetical protein
VFIFFTEFLEALCRLAAAKYDWRPPETPDDDDDIEQPESLRHVALANITELPSANVYGIGPTAPLNPPASEKGRSKSPEGRSSSPEAGGRRGRPRSPAGAPNTDGTASSDTEPVVSALGPQVRIVLQGQGTCRLWATGIPSVPAAVLGISSLSLPCQVLYAQDS